MSPRALTALGLCCVLMASLALAVGPPPQPSAEVRGLLIQLGDDDLAVRKAAMTKLEALGEDAVPYLRQVGRSRADVDVRLRAHAVAGAIERKLFSELKRFTGHQGWVYRVAVAPNGMFAVSSGDALRMWDLDTGKQVRAFAEGNWGWGLDISRDNKRVLVTHSDRSVRLYDLSNGKEVQKFVGHTGEMWMATLSPDGKWAVTGGKDRTIRVWDVATGVEKRTFGPVVDYLRCSAWSPDGKRLAVGHYQNDDISGPGTLRIWDFETGKQVAAGSGHTGALTALSWSKDGKEIASSGFDRTVRIWDAKTARERKRLVVSDQGCDGVAFTPDGRRLVTAGWANDHAARVWDLATRKALAQYDGHSGSVLCVAVTPDGKRVVSSSTDGTVRVWRLGEEVNYGEGPTMTPGRVCAVLGMTILPALALAVGPPAKEPEEVTKHIAQLAAEDAGTRRAAMKKLEALGDPAVPALLRALREHANVDVRLRAAVVARAIHEKEWGLVKAFGPGAVLKAPPPFGGYWLNRVRFSRDGKYAIAAGGAVILYDLTTGKETNRVLEVAADGKHALTGHANSRDFHLLELPSLKTKLTMSQLFFGGHAVALAPDGEHAVLSCGAETLDLVSLKTGRQARRYVGHRGSPRALAISPDGNWLVVGVWKYAPRADDALVCLYAVKSGKLARGLRGHSGHITGAAFVSDSKVFATSSADGTLRVWDVATGKELRKMSHGAAINDLAVSPDGRRALTAGSGDRLVKVWDLRTGNLLESFEGHMGGVLGVAFSPDGRRALSCDTVCCVRLWKLGR